MYEIYLQLQLCWPFCRCRYSQGDRGRSARPAETNTAHTGPVSPTEIIKKTYHKFQVNQTPFYYSSRVNYIKHNDAVKFSD